MKRRLLPVALLLGTMAANAQVGIGTSVPNKSAELLIESNNRGLLIPNVALTTTKDKTTITNGNVQSLLVYATKAQGDITPGYYYWDINVWKRLTADTDIPGIVINKFGDILKGGDVTNLIKNIIKTTEGNVIYEGDKLYHITKEGNKVEINFDGVVKAHQTLTVLAFDKSSGALTYSDEESKITTIDIKGAVKSYETVTSIVNNLDAGTVTFKDEAGKETVVSIKDLVKKHETITTLVDNGNGTYTYTSENGTKTIVDIPSSVVKQFDTIIKQPVTVDGRTFTTVNDYIKYVTEAKGGFTKIVYNKEGDVVFQEWNETKKEWVNVDNSKFSTIVKGNETLTVLGYDKTKNTLSYKDETGKTSTLELGTGAIAYNGATNTITYTDAKGVATTLPLNKTSLTYNEAEQKLVYVDSEGKTQTVNLSTLVTANETLTILNYVQSTNTLTYSDEKGAVKSIVLGTGAIAYNGSTNTITYTDAKGVATTLPLNKTSLTYNEAEQKLVYVDSEGKTQTVNLSTLVTANETVTTLVREEAGKYTYTNEAGAKSTITVIGDLTEVIKGKTDIDLYNILKQLVNVEQTLTQLVYNATSRQLVYTDEQNTPYSIDVDALVKENQTVTTLNGGTNIKVTEVKGNNTISYTLDVPTASKDVAGVVKPGSGLDIDKDGNLIVNLDSALNGKDLIGNEIIVVTDGKGAVLKTTALSINEKAIKLENLGGTLNLAQLQTGNKGDVLVVDENGDVVWSAKDAVTTNKLVLDGTELTSTVNGVGSTQTLKDQLTSEMLKAGSVTADKLGAKPGDEGKVPVVQADGTVVYQNIMSTNVDGKALTSANNLMTVSNAAGVVLKDVVLTVDQTKFDLAQIGGTLQLTKIEKGESGSVLVTDKDGTVKWVKEDSSLIKDLVKANESITTLVDNGKGSFTYYNESDYGADGKLLSTATGTVFNANTLTVTLDKGVYTFTDKSGTELAKIDTNAGAITFNDNTTQLGVTNVQGAIEKLLEKITTVEGTKGNLTGEGIVVSDTQGVILKDVVLSIGKGAITTDKLAAGAVTTEKIAKGESGSVLVTDKDGTVKWVKEDSSLIKDLVKANESITTLVDNGKGSFTYYNESDYGADGKLLSTATGTVFNANTLTVTLDKGVYTFTDKSGTELAKIDTNAGAITFNDNTTQLGVTNVQGAIEKLLEKITTVEGTKGNLTGEGIVVSDTQGVILKDVVLSIGKGAITTDKLAAGAVTTEKIAKGESGSVLVTDKDGTVKWVKEDSSLIKDLVKANESITTLVDNGKGSFTYYNESDYGADGKLLSTATGTVFNANTLTVTLDKGVYTFTDKSGTELAKIDTNAGAITFNDNTTQLGVTNVQVAIEKLLEKITTVEGTKGNLTGEGIVVSDTQGVILKDVVLSIGKGAITTDKLAAGAVTTEKIAKGESGSVLVTDKDGTVKWVKEDSSLIKDLVKANESITTLVDNGKGSFTYYNESDYGADGKLLSTATGTVFNANTLTVTLDKGVYTFTDKSGTELAKIDTNAGAITFNDNTTQLGVTNVQGAIEKLLEKITTVEGTKGNLTGEGIVVSDTQGVILKDVVLSIGKGAITTDKLAAGAVTTEKIAKGESGSVLVTDKDGTVKWVKEDSSLIKDLVKANESITTLVDNGKGSFTYYNESDYGADGKLLSTATGTVFNANTLTVTLDKGVYTFTDKSGTELAKIDTNAGAITFNDNTTQLGVTNVQGAIEKLLEKITTVEGTKGNLTGEGIVVSDTQGVILKDVVLSIGKGAITTDKLAAGAVTTEKIAKGESGSVLVTDKDGTVKWVKEDSSLIKDLVKANESITTLVDNGKGSFTYYNESDYGADGKLLSTATGTVFNANTLTVTLDKGVYTFTDKSGTELAKIDTNAGAITFNDNTTQLGVTNVQGAIEKLLEKITTVEGTKGNLTGEGIVVSDTQGVILKDVVLSIGKGAITTDKLAAGAVTTEKIAKGESGSVLVTDKDGTVKWVKEDSSLIKDLVKANESITTLVDNGKGSFTYYNESDYGADGKLLSTATGTVFNANTLTVTLDKGVYTFTDKSGTELAKIDTNAGAITFNDNTTQLGVTNVQGAIEKLLEKITTVEGTKGNLTGEGIVVSDTQGVILKDVVLSIGKGAITTDKLAAGAVTTEKIAKGESGSVLVTDKDGTVKWVKEDSSLIKDLVKANESITTLVDNGKGSFTYYNESDYGADGKLLSTATGTVFNANTLTVTLDKGVYTFTDKSGTELAKIDTNAGAITFNDNTTQLGVTNVQGAIEKLLEKITTVEGTKGNLTGEGIVVSDTQGVILKDVVLSIGKGAITTDKLAAGAVTTEKIEKGESGSVLVTDKDGTVKWVKEDSSLIKDLVKANESITTLVDNGKGSFTYYNESDYGADGKLLSTATGTVFNANTLTVTLDKGVYTFTDKSGTELAKIDTNAGAITFNDNTTQLGVTNVQGAIEKLLEKITTVEGTKGNLTGEGIVVSDTQGVILKDVVLSIGKGAITTDKLAAGAVTTEKIAKGESGSVLVTDKDGTVKWVKEDSSLIKDLVKANESITTLVDNGKGSFTYYNESDYGADGKLLSTATGTVFNANTLTVTLDKGVYTFTDKSGTELAKIDTNAGAITFNDNTTQLGVTNVQGAIEKLLEKITTVEGTKGNLTGEGIVVSDTQGVILKDVVLSIGKGAITTDKLAAGAVTTEKIAKGESGSVLVTDKDGTVKWVKEDSSLIKDLVKANESITTLVDNGKGSFTYYNESDYGADGKLLSTATGTVFNANTLTVTLDKGVYTFTDKSGTELAKIDTNAGAITFNDNTTQLGVTNVQGAIEKLLEKITTVEGTKGNLTGEGIVVSDTQGVILKDVVLSIGKGAITTDKLAAGAVTTEKIAKGESGSVLVTDKDGTVKWVKEDSSLIKDLVKANESITTLVDNGKGSFTYYNESDYGADGKLLSTATGTVFNANTLTVTLDKGVYTFTDKSGTELAKIDTNAGAITFNDNTTQLGVTNVQGAIEKLLEKITTVEGTKGNLTGEGIVVSDTQGVILKDVVLSIGKGAITTDKLAAGAVTTEKIAKGESGSVLVTDKDGTVKWVTKESVVKGEETVTTLIQGSNIKVSELKEGNSIKYTLDVPVATKDVAGVVKVGEGLNVDGFGNVIVNYDTAKEKLAKGNVTSSSIVVNDDKGNTGSTFKDVTLEIKAGTNGQVMVTKEGKATWVDQSTIVPTTTNAIKTEGTELVTTVNGKDAKLTLIGDVTLKGGKTLVSAIQGTPVSETKPNTLGQALIFKDGQWMPGTPAINANQVSNAANLTTDGIILVDTDKTSSEGSLLKAAKLSLKAGGNSGEVLTTVDNAGVKTVEWKKPLADKDTNIYNVDGTLTGNRTVDFGKFSELKFERKDKDGTQAHGFTYDPTHVGLNMYGNKTSSIGLISGMDTNGSQSKLQLKHESNLSEINANSDKGLRITAGYHKGITLGTFDRPVGQTNDEFVDHVVIKGDGGVQINKINTPEFTGKSTDKVVVADENGVLKTLKAAMPKFFYMPSVMVPTAASQATQAGVTYNNATRTGTIDMYAIYKQQFGTPVMSSVPGATLPVLPASELIFHVTYATQGVFTINSITPAGLMTYTVSSTANVNMGSFINIVFSVKE